jgi:hypothetical protein
MPAVMCHATERHSRRLSLHLAGGQVDATVLPANNAHKLVDEAHTHIIGWVSEHTPWQLGALFTSTQHTPRSITYRAT